MLIKIIIILYRITKYPKRRGFGVTDELINGDDIREQFVLREVTKHIKRFMKSTKQKLVFSIEFTKEERQAIHLYNIQINISIIYH